MEFTIESRKLKKTVTFSIPGSSYIFVDLNGQCGTLGKQICEGGYLFGGGTLSYSGSNEERFKKICRNWFKLYLRNIGSDGA
jgi:hypothetical protein